MLTDIQRKNDTNTSDALNNDMSVFRIDDALSAQAYDATPPALRALLKTAIAFQYHLYAEAPASETRTVHCPAAGFRHTVHEKPAAWTVAVIEPHFDSPARLLAALMPAVLAGVDRIFVVSFGSPIAPSLLVALELAGLEDVFVLPSCIRQQNTVDPLRMLTALFDENPDGRLLLFPTAHARLSPIFVDLARLACHLHLPSWQDAPPRLLALHSPSVTGHSMPLESLLHWAHGNVFITREGTLEGELPLHPSGAQADAEENNRNEEVEWDEMSYDELSLYDACYTGQSSIITAQPSCGLTLGAGMEACWDSLPRDFFRTRFLSASLATRPERDAF